MDWTSLISSSTGLIQNVIEGQNAKNFQEQQKNFLTIQNSRKKHSIQALQDYQTRISAVQNSPSNKPKNFIAKNGLVLGISFGALTLILLGFYADKQLSK